MLNKNSAKLIAADTLKIINDRFYIFNETKIDIAADIKNSIDNTVDYYHTSKLNPFLNPVYSTIFAVNNETALFRAAEIVSRGVVPMVLNFASAVEPGGGWLRGAIAQEESLVRSSTLFSTFLKSDGTPKNFYDKHIAANDPIYSHAAIYSPDVLIFKDDYGNFLERNYKTNFLTSAAVNQNGFSFASLSEDQEDMLHDQICDAMEERIDRVLSIAVENNQTHIVLGAWGCGAFGNSPDLIADMFFETLTNKFKNCFEEVHFSILDNSKEEYYIEPFRELFEV